MTSRQPTGDRSDDASADRATTDDSTAEPELRITLPSATDEELDELSQRVESGERVVIEDGVVSGGEVVGVDIGDVDSSPNAGAEGSVAEGNPGELGDRVEGPPDD